MSTEYDFSPARRLRYASSLTPHDREELLQRSASLDAQYWFGLALQRTQELEAMVVAYLVLAMEHAPRVAEREAVALFNSKEPPALFTIAASVASTSAHKTEFEERFSRVTRGREWLVHKGGLAVLSTSAEPAGLAGAVTRLAATAHDATELVASLRSSLEARLARLGLSAEEVQQKTTQVIGRWLAA